MKTLLRSKTTIIVILVLTLILAWIAFFGPRIPGTDYALMSAGDMRFGIDIRGGVDATFVPKDLDRQPTAAELEAARTVIETRLDQNNILDRDVTLDTQNGSVIVRFPWKSSEADFNPDKAIQELGSMAHLTFRDPSGAIVLEGKHVQSTTFGQDESGTKVGYVVHLVLTGEGRDMFSEATGRLIGQEISIFMDDEEISSPIVRTRIDSNECVISDIATAAEAKLLSNQINSGALPFSLIAENYSAISPQLGSNALEVMVTAGVWAFALICLGLIAYYRLSGVIAAISLLLQIAGIVFMITIPQITVTLSGIAGIILSIGMGVDANIIAAEHIREELRSGKRVGEAIKTGFERAFSAVFDGNVTVLIVSFIMMWLGSGAVLSFAYTLLFGIIMNFVAGVLATRLMSFSLSRYEFAQNPVMFLPKRLLGKTETRVFPFYKKRKLFYGISAMVMVVGLVFMFTNGILLDIQFKGGTILKYSMSEEIELDTQAASDVAESVLGGHVVSAQITEDYATGERRLVLSMSGGEALDSEELESVTEALRAEWPEQAFVVAETNSVTPFFGQKFLTNGLLSLAISAALIILYVWYSFRRIHGLSAGVIALLALLHDVLVVFFVFVVFRIPIGDMFVTVALTILGYSINDTIVIYDRIRENTRLHPRMAVEDMVDMSVSQSFTRSLNTNIAVFVSVMLIYVFAAGNGLESVRAFALPMAIGTISGCYSTVCFSGPLWTMWQKRKAEKQQAAK